MLRLYPEQLRMHLNKELSMAYLLLGDNYLLLQESQDAICQMATTQGFYEHHTIQINNGTNWQTIFSLCQSISLFSSRQILTLMLPENGLGMVINKNLAMLVKLLHQDLLLVIRGNKLTKEQESASWFTRLTEIAVLVMCQSPDRAQLPKWVIARARLHNLQLDKHACQLLCYSYEGNFLALEQVLELLSLLCPDGRITLARIKQVVNDTSYFTPFHWVDALFVANSKRALHVLQQLRLAGSEPNILLRILQRELLLLINLQRQSTILPLCVLFDKYRILQGRRTKITEAINRFGHNNQLRRIVHFLAQIELTLKRGNDQSIWRELEILSFLLCKEEFADVFLDS